MKRILLLLRWWKAGNKSFVSERLSRLVKQGGVRGVGVTMITQRPADINKKVLSQVDILTVLRMSHPLDIAAATGWIRSEVSLESRVRSVKRCLHFQ